MCLSESWPISPCITLHHDRFGSNWNLLWSSVCVDPSLIFFLHFLVLRLVAFIFISIFVHAWVRYPQPRVDAALHVMFGLLQEEHHQTKDTQSHSCSVFESSCLSALTGLTQCLILLVLQKDWYLYDFKYNHQLGTEVPVLITTLVRLTPHSPWGPSCWWHPAASECLSHQSISAFPVEMKTGTSLLWQKR